MNDVNSKMQQWFNQVSNGFSRNSSSALPGLSNYSCSLDATGYPLLRTGGSGTARGQNPDCVYLGKAIHLPFDSAEPRKNTNIAAYTVLSRRTYTPLGLTSPTIVDNLVSSNPAVAIYDPGLSPTKIDLSEYYKIPSGAYIKSIHTGATSTCTSNCSLLAGIYSSLSNAGTQQAGTSTLTAVQYPYINGGALPGEDSIRDCIKMQSASSCSYLPSLSRVNPWPLQQWTICFASSRNNDRALITITSNNGVGVKTKLTKGIGDTFCS
jgi:hypothetical protein